MAELTTELAGVKLENPTVLSAGILGNTGEILKRVGLSGAGAVTTKTIGLKPRKGNKNPTVVDMGDVFLNAMGLPNPGAENFVEEIRIAKEGGKPIISSIFGKDAGEFAEVAKILKKAEPDLFELNISCPNVGSGMSFGCDPVAAGKVVEKVKAVTDISLSVKMTPNTHLLVEVAKSVEKAGASVITAINGLGPGMVIDVETGIPVLANKVGGVSGKFVRPIATRCIYSIAQAVKIPIIGVGGIYSGEDAAQHIIAGASAVGIGTAVKDHYLDIFKKVCDELDVILERKKLKSIGELVGTVKEVLT
jgi:dihydroorotate dehydrogenase (NAD+) catalytic subunit|tara:strand:+ start:4378 stop:5295 length:918 start_codon:yes stop_codon:yes gene_type:complete